MFWHLLFAHFLSDYPLQSDWMVAHKQRLHVLLLHVGIHLAVMLVMVGAYRWVLWPYLVGLTSVHFLIDLAKNFANARKPGWVVVPYLVDQTTHYLSIAAIVSWIRASLGELPLPLDTHVVIVLTGFLLATYVWYISERVMTSAAPAYRQFVINMAWQRMLLRAGLLGAFLWVFNRTVQVGILSAALIATSIFARRYTRLAFVIDLLVSASIFVLIYLSL